MMNKSGQGGIADTLTNKLQFVEKLRHKRVLTWGRHIPASALPTWDSMPQLAIQRKHPIQAVLYKTNKPKS